MVAEAAFSAQQEIIQQSGIMMRLTIACLVLTAALGCGSREEPVGQDVEHLLAAQEALEQGDKQKALQELNMSIEIKPDGWAYYHRAKIQGELGNEKAAIADCEAGLKLDPNHQELKWLRAELKKPSGQRFKGRNASSPTIAK